jgi:RNA recognition motif-containing protein
MSSDIKKLYIGNLPYSADETQLRELFGADGRTVTSVKIMLDRETGRPRGFAFVEFATAEEAAAAMAALNHKDFGGRPLSISEARAPAPRVGGFGGGGGGLPTPRTPGVSPVSSVGSGGGYRPSRPPMPTAYEEPAPQEDRNRERNKGKERDRNKRNRGEDW